jgi:hypothetical protein
MDVTWMIRTTLVLTLYGILTACGGGLSRMKADRSIQSGLLFVVSGLLAACSGGSSLTSFGGQSLSSAYRSPAAIQNASGMARPNDASCVQNGRQVTLASTEVKIRFPENCVSGDILIPAVTNLQSPPQTVDFCQGSQPITQGHRPRGCTVSEPHANCQQASSTFWYATLTLWGEDAGEKTDFSKKGFPIKFSSDSLIMPGYLYGLCVIDVEIESVMQDDFASGNAVAPSGDTVHLKITLPSYYDKSLVDSDALDIFFESKPVSS